MSPRAACRLERFGFDQVYDYIAGIADWKAAGLPIEGQSAPVQQVADATRPDIPTCTPNESLADVRRRTLDAGWDECVVVDCERVVIGRLRNQAWDAGESATVEEVMEPGPTTVRPHTLLQPLVGRMSDRGTKLVVVTNPEGELMGALARDEAQRLLSGEPPEEIWHDCDGCPGQWHARRTDQEAL